jgi:hypothetical protein
MLVIKSESVETKFLSEAELPAFARPPTDVPMELQDSEASTSGASSNKPTSSDLFNYQIIESLKFKI